MVNVGAKCGRSIRNLLNAVYLKVIQLKEVLSERAKNVGVLAADHQTPLNYHINALKVNSIKVVIGTLTRIDNLLCANAIS